MDSKKLLGVVRQSNERRELLKQKIKDIDMDAFSFYSLAGSNARDMAQELEIDRDLTQLLVTISGMREEDIKSIFDKGGYDISNELEYNITYVKDKVELDSTNDSYKLIPEAVLAKNSIILTHIALLLEDKCKKTFPIDVLMENLVVDSKEAGYVVMGNKNTELITTIEKDLGAIYPKIEVGKEYSSERER